MSYLKFTWNDHKNNTNQKKHGISFEEAQTVFFDENAFEYFDTDHSQDEERYLMLGYSYRLRVLVVCYCYRKDSSEIRIISSRKATKKEHKIYFGERK